jgi:hypothetical protein
MGMQAEIPAPKPAISTRTRTPLGISLPLFKHLLNATTSSTNGAIMTIRGSAAICPVEFDSGKDASGDEETFGEGC